jgi:HAE1 family hydrophobic/amphiphilic exporter-1
MNSDQWSSIQAHGTSLGPSDVADLSRIATTGRKVGHLTINSRVTDVIMRYPNGLFQSAEDLGALPIGMRSKLIPLKAIANVEIEEVPPTRYRENERDVVLINGKNNEGSERKPNVSLHEAKKLVSDWKPTSQNVTATFEDAEKDLHEALKQLSIAVGLSVLLIFLTLLLQFGSLINAILVLVAIPLGFIGVLVSLFVFRSTLSLNSVLGVILLNGIAVANSIILVDFIKRLVDEGHSPEKAAEEAARKRLRPILITSLTTILGMLPVALGMGEGGKILQPLGIAVSGGLWVSMGLTLFIVPALQVRFLKWKASRMPRPQRTTEPADRRSHSPGLVSVRKHSDKTIEQMPGQLT